MSSEQGLSHEIITSPQLQKMSETRVLIIGGYSLSQCSFTSEVFEIGQPTTISGPDMIVPISKFSATVAISELKAIVYGGENCQTAGITDSTFLVDLETNRTTLLATSTVNGPRYNQTINYF